MNIIKDINSKRLERKLDNGLTEVKEFFEDGELEYHYFLNENGSLHGEWKEYAFQIKSDFLKFKYIRKYRKNVDEQTQLVVHKLYENGKIIKDYLEENNEKYNKILYM